MVKRWYADFKRRRTDTDGAERPGRPNSVAVVENTKKLHKLVLADRKLKLCKYLSTRKHCSKWVPRLLTVNQKQQRIDDSERYLPLFQRNK